MTEEAGATHTEEEGAEEDGVGGVEEEGADHVEHEELGSDVDGGNSDPEDSGETVHGGRYSLRPNRAQAYSHLFDSRTYHVTNRHIPHNVECTMTPVQQVFGFMFTQMSARAGIKKHGQGARDDTSRTSH